MLRRGVLQREIRVLYLVGSSLAYSKTHTEVAMPQGAKIGMEEKGQMAGRNLEPHPPKGSLMDGSVCKGCGIVYRNKRWQLENVPRAEQGEEILCPACQRIQGDRPAGVVTLSGPYLAQHKEEILNSLKQHEAKHRDKNPLGRIMQIKEEDGQLIITTTDDKLAQKIGREIYKSQKGELQYQWSHDQRMVRVNWMR